MKGMAEMLTKINLKVGEPVFYKKYWDSQNVIPKKSDSLFNYPKNNESTINSIISLHNLIHGYELKPENIIIGNGASQIISAAAYAVDLPELKVPPPYWRRIKELCKIGYYSSENVVAENTSQSENLVITSPNNPDGVVYSYDQILLASFVDCCYNWPQYVHMGLVHKIIPKISIYSLSKCLGLAGLRMGWAVVTDDLLANKMRQFIEVSTAGVNVKTQSIAYDYINHTVNKLQNDETDCFSWATSELDDRWDEVIEAFSGTDMQVINPRKGMFLWIQKPNEENLALLLDQKYGIISMSGEECGGTNDFVRINLGCDIKDLKEFVRRISNVKADKTGNRGVPTV